jgi:hypothetical protein
MTGRVTRIFSATSRAPCFIREGILIYYVAGEGLWLALVTGSDIGSVDLSVWTGQTSE